jgi:hypothetical protein
MADFTPFPKVPRWSRDIIITEKIDGTNASIFIGDDGEFLVGSRTRWITPGKLTDNYGFAAWAQENKEDLLTLGPGHHFGEWWGKGIQRGYGLNERRFSLFNVSRWFDQRPACCHLVPILYQGANSERHVAEAIHELARYGSLAANGFMDPEGIMIFHTAAGMAFKKTIKDDETPKSLLQ